MKKSTLSNLKLRSVTGFVYAVVLLISIFAEKYLFLSILAILMFLALYEYTKMMRSTTAKNSIIRLMASLIFSFFLFILIFQFNYEVILIFSIAYICLVIIGLFFLSKIKSKFFQLFYGYLWISGAISLFIVFIIKQDKNIYLMLIPVVLSWLNDTFAYFGGILFGKHKLFPKISPHKTIEGFISGIIISVFASIAFYYIIEGKSLLIYLISAAVLSLAAVVGDLVESIIKRQYQVKDSGNILPGHGGILDRIDSFLFVFPIFIILSKFLFQ